MRILAAIIAVFVSLPIWFYLVYKILELVAATELMWFLFYLYIPATIFSIIVFRVLDKK